MESNNVRSQSVQPEAQQGPPNLVTGFIERLSQKWESLPPEKRVYFIQLGLIAATQATDILTTYVALQTIPGGMEGNPVARFLLDKGGMGAFGSVKMGAAILTIRAMEVWRDENRGETDSGINNTLRFWNSICTAMSVNNAVLLINNIV